MAEIHLGLAGPVDQGHEDLAVFAFQAPNGLFDLGIAAGVAVLGLEALEDALGRVVLLFVDVLVVLEDLLDSAQEGPDLWLGPLLLHLVAGRLAVFEDFLQGLPVDAFFLHHLALGDPLHQDFLADFSPLVHVLVHSFFLPEMWLENSTSSREFRGVSHFSTAFLTPQTVTLLERRLQFQAWSI